MHVRTDLDIYNDVLSLKPSGAAKPLDQDRRERKYSCYKARGFGRFYSGSSFFRRHKEPSPSITDNSFDDAVCGIRC